MATRTTRRRLRTTRRPTQSPQETSQDSYRRIRAAIALGIFIACFGLLWLINGEFTAQYIHARFSVPLSYGWAWHIVISSLELASVFVAPYLAGLPRWLYVVLLICSLPFGVFDVLSSAIGMEPYMLWTGMIAPTSHVQNTVLAELVAFLPERMIWYLLIALLKVLRS
jgi:hypothetical protein